MHFTTRPLAILLGLGLLYMVGACGSPLFVLVYWPAGLETTDFASDSPDADAGEGDPPADGPSAEPIDIGNGPPPPEEQAAQQATLAVRLVPEFGPGDAVQAGQGLPYGGALLTECQDGMPSEGPPYAAGLDCDGDGGPTQYITPVIFAVALKRLTVYDRDGIAYDLIADTGKLADARVLDLTGPLSVGALQLPVGAYTRVTGEVYYYETVIPLNDPPVEQRVRVYLSDDDFEDEGLRGHHQGDLTLIDEAGQELGFVMIGRPWTRESLAGARGDWSNGGAGVDPETGHARGIGVVGDAGLWNSDSFMQGVGQDLFVFQSEFGLELTEAGATVSLRFDLANLWFFEDFNGNQVFDPCGTPNATGQADACQEDAHWVPFLPFPPAVELGEADAEAGVARRI